MRIGTGSVKKALLGVIVVGAGYFGVTSISTPPSGGDLSLLPPVTHPLLQEEGEWGNAEHVAMRATWVGSTTYAPNLVEPIFDVTDYGAIPNDELPDTYAFRAAIAAQDAANGGTVYIPAGEFILWPDAVTDYPNNSYPAAINIHHSPFTMEGAGPDQTILNYRAPDGRDPNEDQLYRGIMFSTLFTPTPLDGITLRGFRATGNAQVTDSAGLYEGVGSLQGWDTTHKFIGIFGTLTNTIDNVLLEFIEADHWRGEVFYGGGGVELKNMTVRDCIVRRANSSMISMGGFVTVERCWLKSGYNGTECFSLDADHGLTVRDTVINVNDDLPPGVPNIGKFGVVYLGISTSELTVDNCDIGYTTDGGIFLSEAATNVTITDNRFTDTVGVYSLYLNQYPNEPAFAAPEPDKWKTHLYSGNTFTAATRDVSAAIVSLATQGEDWTMTNNTLVDTGEFQFSAFVSARGSSGDFIFTNNTIGGVAQPYIPYVTTTYPTVWTGNTITGAFADGLHLSNGTTDGSIADFNPYWPKVNVTFVQEMQKRIRIPNDTVVAIPTGYQVEIRAVSGLFGAEVQPDPAWNSLTRGYMIYAGAVLTLVKNASGVMDFVSYTPPSAGTPTQTQDGPIGFNFTQMKLAGTGAINLSPSSAFTFNEWAGIAIGETVTLNYNGNVTLDHVPGVMEIDTGSDFVAGGSGSISATRANDGTLLVGTHTVTEDAPLIGAVQSGDSFRGEYQMDVILIQDGANPSAVDGYYSIERRQGIGAWSEIVQVPKASVTGTRKTYTHTDLSLTRGEEYQYRARAVSPGTPDVVSRWSNTATETLVPASTEVYKTASGQELEIDIYQPNNSLIDRTAVICVHGGGWTSSSKAVHAAHCVHFASQGVVAFNIDYRLDDGTVDMEDQVADVRAAIRWVRENCAAWGVDPDDIVILGESAGGHLAGVAAFVDAFDDTGGNLAVSSRPNRAVLVNPITYLPGLPWYQGNAAQVGATPVPNDTTQLTPASTGADLSLRLSPQLYANITPAPPVLFIHGDEDSVVPFAQSEDMHDLLILAGNTSTLETMVGSDHSFFLPGVGTTAEINATLAIIDAFLTP